MRSELELRQLPWPTGPNYEGKQLWVILKGQNAVERVLWQQKKAERSKIRGTGDYGVFLISRLSTRTRAPRLLIYALRNGTKVRISEAAGSITRSKFKRHSQQSGVGRVQGLNCKETRTYRAGEAAYWCRTHLCHEAGRGRRMKARVEGGPLPREEMGESGALAG